MMMGRLDLPVGFVLALVMGACTSAPISKTSPPKPDAFQSQQGWTIQPGATVSIVVQGESSFSMKDMAVDHDGLLYYRPIGTLKVANLSESQLTSLLTQRLSKDFFHDPRVSVTVKNRAKIYILGEVKNPGLFEIDHPMTVFEAIQLAENFSAESKRDTIRIVRQTSEGEQVKVIPLKKMGTTWIKNENILVMPNDLIMVN